MTCAKINLLLVACVSVLKLSLSLLFVKMRPVTEITLWEMRMELYFPLISQRSCARQVFSMGGGWRVKIIFGHLLDSVRVMVIVRALL